MQWRLFFIVISVGLAMPAWADFASGLAAYQQGDFTTAIRELKADGSPRSNFLLGVMFLNGKGVTADKEEAIRWIRKAAERGEAEAQEFLGTLYFRDKIIKSDRAEGIKWL